MPRAEPHSLVVRAPFAPTKGRVAAQSTVAGCDSPVRRRGDGTGVVAVDPDRYLNRSPMTRTPIDQLLHRVNNLLGTIELQAAAATAVGTKEAMQNALRLVVDSARKTAEEVQRFRAGGGDRSITSPPAASS